MRGDVERPERWFFSPRWRHSQRHDVGVGVVHGDGDGVVLVLVFGVVVGSSLQKQANEAATEKREVTSLSVAELNRAHLVSPAAQMELSLPSCVCECNFYGFSEFLRLCETLKRAKTESLESAV